MTDQPSQTPLTQEQIERIKATAASYELQSNDASPLRNWWADVQALCDMALALSAARRDAERYRWLREQRHADIAACWILPSKDYREVNSPEELDAAIDAAKGGK